MPIIDSNNAPTASKALIDFINGTNDISQLVPDSEQLPNDLRQGRTLIWETMLYAEQSIGEMYEHANQGAGETLNQLKETLHSLYWDPKKAISQSNDLLKLVNDWFDTVADSSLPRHYQEQLLKTLQLLLRKLQQYFQQANFVIKRALPSGIIEELGLSITVATEKYKQLYQPPPPSPQNIAITAPHTALLEQLITFKQYVLDARSQHLKLSAELSPKLEQLHALAQILSAPDSRVMPSFWELLPTEATFDALIDALAIPKEQKNNWLLSYNYLYPTEHHALNDRPSYWQYLLHGVSFKPYALRQALNSAIKHYSNSYLPITSEPELKPSLSTLYHVFVTKNSVQLAEKLTHIITALEQWQETRMPPVGIEQDKVPIYEDKAAKAPLLTWSEQLSQRNSMFKTKRTLVNYQKFLQRYKLVALGHLHALAGLKTEYQKFPLLMKEIPTGELTIAINNFEHYVYSQPKTVFKAPAIDKRCFIASIDNAITECKQHIATIDNCAKVLQKVQASKADRTLNFLRGQFKGSTHKKNQLLSKRYRHFCRTLQTLLNNHTIPASSRLDSAWLLCQQFINSEATDSLKKAVEDKFLARPVSP